jgi:hypothetical protein
MLSGSSKTGFIEGANGFIENGQHNHSLKAAPRLPQTQIGNVGRIAVSGRFFTRETR